MLHPHASCEEVYGLFGDSGAGVFRGAALLCHFYFLEVKTMIAGLLKMTGMLVLMIVYGKHYKEKFESGNGMVGIMLLFSLLNILWLIDLGFLFSGSTGNDTALCVVIAIAYPLCIAVWAIITRRKYNSMSPDNNNEKDKNQSCNGNGVGV